MKISMDGLRQSLADCFDNLVSAYNDGHSDLSEEIYNVGKYVGALLCIYDDAQEDFTDMSSRELFKLKLRK